MTDRRGAGSDGKVVNVGSVRGKLCTESFQTGLGPGDGDDLLQFGRSPGKRAEGSNLGGGCRCSVQPTGSESQCIPQHRYE